MGDVKVTFSAETQAALAKIQGFFSQIERDVQKLGGALATGLGIDVGRRLLDGLLQIPNAIRDATRSGVEFNRTLEDARIGIAAVLRQFDPQKFDTFGKALKTADAAMGALQKKALESPATFQQLVGTFQALTGPATGAGIALQKQVDLVVLMSQALAGLGIRSEQLIQESRALITGNINQDAAAAKILGITSSDIERAKEAGQLYEFLFSKLSAFSEAGKVSAETLTVAQSNLKDAMEQTFATLARPVFETLKQSYLGLTAEFAKPEFKQGLQELAQHVNELVKGFFALGSFAVRHARELATAFTALAASIAAATAAMVAFKVASAFGATQIVGLLGAVTGFRDLGAVIALTATQTVSAAATMGVAIAGIVTATYAGVEAWRAFKAAQQEALALKNLEGSNDKFRAALTKQINDLRDAGKISAEQAATYLAELEKAFTAKVRTFYPPAATASPARPMPVTVRERDAQAESDTLRRIYRELSGFKTEQEKADAAEAVKISKQAADGQRQVEIERLNFEAATLEVSLARKLITQEEFEKRRREIIQETYELEVELGAKTDQEKEQLSIKRMGKLLEFEEQQRRVRQQAADDEREMQEKMLDELDQYLRERGEKEKQLADMRASVAFGRNQLAIDAVSGDPNLSEEEKLTRLRPLYEERNQLLQQAIGQQRELQAMATATEETQLAAQEKINDAMRQHLGIQQEIANREKAINEQRVRGTSKMFGDMATAAKAFGKEGFASYKAFAIAQATVDTAASAVSAYKSVVGIPYVGPILAPIAAAAAVAAGAAQIATIANQQYGYRAGGYTGDGDPGDVAGQVHRGEYVFDATATRRIGVATLEALRSARSVSPSAPDFSSFTATSSSPNVNVEAAPVSVIVVHSEEEFYKAMESQRGRRVVTKHIRSDRGSAGFDT